MMGSCSNYCFLKSCQSRKMKQTNKQRKAMSVIKPGMLFRHLNSGLLYKVLCTGKTVKTLRPNVVYQSLYHHRGHPCGTVWIRPLDSFNQSFKSGPMGPDHMGKTTIDHITKRKHKHQIISGC